MYKKGLKNKNEEGESIRLTYFVLTDKQSRLEYD